MTLQTILGTKIGQTQKFTSEGVRIPVSLIQAGPCVVVQVKRQGKDGYDALQLGFGERREKITPKPVREHIKKAGIQKIPRFLREIRLGESEEFKPGDEIKIGDVLKPGDIVNVTGISKGRGFAGGVKRWGFAGGPKTHGQSDRERAPGSIGSATTPGRVLKGKHMAGRMGGEQVTVRNLLVMETDEEKNQILVKGVIPGARRGLIFIEKVGEDKKFVEKQERQGDEESQEKQEEKEATE